MSFSSPRSVMANRDPTTPIGTTIITANGIDQLSYSAARHRNTTTNEMAYNDAACPLVRRS
ncbi:hypothetical protein D3C85_1851170 [compost metagenome]